MAKTMEADQVKIYNHVELMVANSNKAIEDSINRTIVSQLREMDKKQAALYEQVGDIVQ